jgi:quercetin dioxygenase-like cupin family protein
MKLKTTVTTVTASVVLLGAVALSVPTGAQATAPSSPGPTPSMLAVGTLDGPSKAKKDHIELKVGQDTTVRTFTLTYPPGSSSGWHAHPGIVLAVVEKGSVTRQLDDCSAPQRFSAGEAFTEVTGHLVTNPGATEAVLRITQLVPAGSTELRRDLPDPGC